MPVPLPPLAALPWFIPYVTLPPLSRRTPRLADQPPASGRLVSVIVPARNEAATLPRLLASLAQTTYAPVEFIVVDDGSTDGTAAIVTEAGARDGRFRLIRGEPLPAGWFGKPWACHQGAAAARGELLAFTDADTVHAPALLGHAAGAQAASGAGLITVVTGQELVTFWERVVMPQIWVPLGARYHPRRVNAATRPRDVIANGQFLLVTRDAYERAGTHESVRGEIAEDMAIGQQFVRRGLGLRMYWAEELIRTRMYTGFRHLAEGWSKNLYLGVRGSFPDEPVLRALAPLVPIAGLLFWLAPFGALAGGMDWAPWAIGISLAFWSIVCAGMGIPVWYAVTYPLGALVALWLMTRSAWRGARRIEWRGRIYRGGTAADGARAA